MKDETLDDLILKSYSKDPKVRDKVIEAIEKIDTDKMQEKISYALDDAIKDIIEDKYDKMYEYLGDKLYEQCQRIVVKIMIPDDNLKDKNSIQA